MHTVGENFDKKENNKFITRFFDILKNKIKKIIMY